MTDISLRVWGRTISLRGFADAELAEVYETFAGSIAESADAGELSIVRQRGTAAGWSGTVRSRHRGGSSARKYFLDGTPYAGGEQHRDIGVVSEGSGCDVYAWQHALVVVVGQVVTLVAPDHLPPMLLCDVIEDWLLCRSRGDAAVQVHCAAWLDNGIATLTVGSSGVGKTTELFRRLRQGARFFSNDRAFLRYHEGVVQARSFPLPVNVGCGTIRSLGLPLPDHGLGDHDKIRLRPPEVVDRFGADYESWWPVGQVICASLEDLSANIYWDEDDCHPFWVRGWRPEPYPADAAEVLTDAMQPLILAQPVLTW